MFFLHSRPTRLGYFLVRDFRHSKAFPPPSQVLILAELLALEERMRGDDDASPASGWVPRETPFRAAGHDAVAKRGLLASRWQLAPDAKPKLGQAPLLRSPYVGDATSADSHFEPDGSPLITLLRCEVNRAAPVNKAPRLAVAFCADTKAVLRGMIDGVEGGEARVFRLLLKQLGQVTDMQSQLDLKRRATIAALQRSRA